MRTALDRLELREPRTLAEALRLLRDEEGLVPVAGGTDIYVGLNFGTLPATRFLNLWRVGSLHRIAVTGDVLRIGALATYTALIRSRHVRQRLPMLVQAAREVGGIQIQNRGTVGGNIANASPAGDTLPVLAVADAVVILRSATGERRVPFGEFYTGYRETVRRPEELIEAVEIPRVAGTQWFRKVGTRVAQAISKVVMAAVRTAAPRLALGSVGPTVVRLPRTEAALASGADIEEAVRILEAEIRPIDDVRSTAAYRRGVSGNLLRRFWLDTAPPGAPAGDAPPSPS
ncbi:MAG: FAD binding domain-containing protein [Gemmatimonadales bacterium]